MAMGSTEQIGMSDTVKIIEDYAIVSQVHGCCML